MFWVCSVVPMLAMALLLPWLTFRWARFLGFRGSVALGAIVGLTPVLAVLAFRRSMRYSLRRELTKVGLCASCGYDLTGNTSGQCPECGARVPAPGMTLCMSCRADVPFQAVRCAECGRRLPPDSAGPIARWLLRGQAPLSPSERKEIGAALPGIGMAALICLSSGALAAWGVSRWAGVPLADVPIWLWLWVPLLVLAVYAVLARASRGANKR
jgi:hypothetical protein